MTVSQSQSCSFEIGVKKEPNRPKTTIPPAVLPSCLRACKTLMLLPLLMGGVDEAPAKHGRPLDLLFMLMCTLIG